MAVVSHKCPNCGAGLIFDPKKKKLMCEYCLSEFTEDEMKNLEVGEGTDTERTKNIDSEDSKNALEGGMVVYTCPSCGAEIVTDETTAATFCYYCHNPVVLSGRVSGEYLPDSVIPFSIDRKQAEQMFMTWIGKKKFVPKSFSDKKQIEKLSGVYFPYLLYSCQVDGTVYAEAEKEKSWVAGNMRNTEHRRYRVVRSGSLDVKNLTKNALSKTNKQLVEGVLPFETSAMLPFDKGYLSGFLAEKRDMESESFRDEAEGEVEKYTIQNLTSSITGYHSFKIHETSTGIRNAKWRYALLPVWVLTYQHQADKKLYYFTINGQTGKICGKLPVDKGKLAGLFAGVFIPLFACLMLGGWFL